MSNKITVIDYGMGNIWSVLSALRYLGCNPIVSNDPDEIACAESLLLPGVGSFRKAMHSLRESSIDKAILEAVQGRGSKILGICLGMQLMGSYGYEDGETTGLGLIPNPVDFFTPDEIGTNKIPHIGFDLVNSQPDSILFQGLSDAADFYFVHSYRMLPHGLNGKAATCSYGTEFLAAYEQPEVLPQPSQT